VNRIINFQEMEKIHFTITIMDLRDKSRLCKAKQILLKNKDNILKLAKDGLHVKLKNINYFQRKND